nr:hypothetical protein [Actinomycetales bacterium]
MTMAPEQDAADPSATRSSRSARAAAKNQNQQSQKTQNQAPGQNPVARKRSPMMMAIALMLIALSALGGVWLANQGNETRSVIRIAADVQPGERIEAADLAQSEISVDVVDLQMVGWDQLNNVVGRVAQQPLYSGSLLTEGAFASAYEVGEDEWVIAVTLEPSRMPAIGLSAGRNLIISETPASVNDLNVVMEPKSGTYISQREVGTTGTVVLTVAVDRNDAAELTARNAVGRLTVAVGEPRG